jgi:hypothetical protein
MSKLVIRKTLVQYQNLGTYHSKVIAKVNVFGGCQKDRKTE